MKLITNASMRMKLISIFIVFAILTLVVGIIGYQGLSRAQAISADTYTQQTVPIEQMTQVIEHVLICSSNFDMAILASDDPDAVEEYRVDTNKRLAEIPTLLNAYKPSLANKEEEDAFNAAFDIYNTVLVPKAPEVFDLLAKGQAEDADAVMGSIDAKIGEMYDAFQECRNITSETNAKWRTDNNESFESLKFVMLVVLIAVALLVIVLGIVIPPALASPMVAIMKISDQVSTTGNLELPADWSKDISKFAQNQDEMGKTSRSFVNMLNMLRERAVVIHKIADGDLTPSVATKSNDDEMGVALNTMLDALNSTFSSINATSVEVAENARDVAESSISLAQGATEQTAAVGALSRSITQVSEKTEETAALARNAATLGDTIKANAEKGSVHMDHMMDAVRQITNASASIGKVIKVIDDIAFQTNILALNAAVEAARAGQHGKGFAVVAEEVRNLAAKSASAAKETGTLIENSIAKAELGAKIADETAASLSDIVSGINESSKIVNTIAVSSEAQTKAILEINSGIKQVGEVVHLISKGAELSSSASDSMRIESSDLHDFISRYQLKQTPGSARLGSRKLAMPAKLTSDDGKTGASLDSFGKY